MRRTRLAYEVIVYSIIEDYEDGDWVEVDSDVEFEEDFANLIDLPGLDLYLGYLVWRIASFLSPIYLWWKGLHKDKGGIWR